MASNLSSVALRSIRALFTAGTVGGLTDGQLLERLSRTGTEFPGLRSRNQTEPFWLSVEARRAISDFQVPWRESVIFGRCSIEPSGN